MSSSDNNNKNAFPVRGAGFISQDDSFLHVAIALDSTNNVRDDHGQPNPAPYPKRNEVFVDDQPEIASGSIADEKVVEKAQCRPQRWKVLATVLVIGIIVIIIAIVTTKGKNKSSPLSNYLAQNSFDNGAALSTGDSSQQKALKFLEQSTLNNGPFDYTLLQVYTLVVLNYATGETQSNEDYIQWQSRACKALNYIICSESKITELKPNSAQLFGSLPPEIGLLTSLTHLSLFENTFNGPLPTEIRFLTSLKFLYLSSNKFNGTLPSEIGRLTSLKYLNLFSNAFAGTLPSEIGLLTSLTFLSLYNNDFAGTLPSEIGLLTSLIFLDLRSNFFTGFVPSEISNLNFGEDCNPTSVTCAVPPP